MNDKSPIFQSLAMIEEKIRERLTVEMLAAGIHFSKYHYQRIFREAVGDSVMGYVTRRKLFLAAEELAGTKDPVLEIALKYGYDSHEGFARSFKTHLGVTPTEYRKYHSALHFPERKVVLDTTKRKKEKRIMKHSKHTDELVKELNSLIVQAKETAEDTRKHQKMDTQSTMFYAQFWNLAAGRAEKMAEELEKILKRVAMAAQGADEISAHFLLIKAIDDTAFEANVTAFHVGLMIARAMPEHQAMFQPLCARYDSLAQNAQIKSRKMVDFLNELLHLILQDMKQQAEQKIQDAIESGRAGAKKLSNPTLPYNYIADGITAIAERLDSQALEDVTLSSLVDTASTLETIHFVASMDILRAPQHRELFDGITDFKEKLDEAANFFQSLTSDGLWRHWKTKNNSERNSTEGKFYNDLAAQEEIVLFCLKGEIQKLGDAHLDARQKTTFDSICSKIDRAVKMSRSSKKEEKRDKITELLLEAYDELTKEAEELNPYGGAIRYLAEKVKMPLQGASYIETLQRNDE